MKGTHSHSSPDVVLVGAGIMSATLAVILKELQPDLKIEIFESLPKVASESSNAWNNAGTGHAALCELNYTPQLKDGSIDVSKALDINESFEVSKQLWSYLIGQGSLPSAASFIQPVPHMSFVWGEKNVNYLRKRYEALHVHSGFTGMQYSQDHGQLKEWIPLVMEGRDKKQKISATRTTVGTDVNFGALTGGLISYLKKKGVKVHVKHRVVALSRKTSGASRWNIGVKDEQGGRVHDINAKFVFLGGGGGALPLLQLSGIPEGRGFGGFPVSGQWLRCDNPELVNRHDAKVYGKASVGAPPMSVPHLDTRIIDGKKSLLFGPYAGFSTRFLKHGSLLDLPLSVKMDNLLSMLSAGRDNIDLTKYLIGQVIQSPEQRLDALRDFVPKAKMEDWKLEIAGQRVQIIKKDPKKGGVLQFGTEVVCAGDGSIAALLGASPGASTAVSIMLKLLGECFKDKLATPGWREKLKTMIPSFGESLKDNEALGSRVRSWTTETLGLDMDPVPAA